MKNKHLKLVSCALMASLFSTSSCVDNDYDLMEDIDLTIQVGGSEFAIPGGETEPIKLSKILDIEEDGVVKIDEDGNYFLLQEGTESNTRIFVDRFSVASPWIEPLLIEPGIELPINGGGMLPPGERFPGTLEKNKFTTSFGMVLPDEQGNKLPDELISASYIKANLVANLDFTLEQDIVNAMRLDDIRIEFPEYFVSNDLDSKGVLTLTNQNVTRSGGYHKTIYITAIDLDKLNSETQGTGIKEGKLDIKGVVKINGTVSVLSDDINVQHSSHQIELKAVITLGDMEVNAVTGVVQPDIDINIDPVTLSDLPDFLNDDEVRLDVYNPMVFFMANNQTPVKAIADGVITAWKKNEDGSERQLGDPQNKPVDFSLKIAKEKEQKFCLSPIDTILPGTKWVKVEYLPTLITEIPDEFRFNIDAYASDEPTEVELNREYFIKTDYEVNVPFVFGENLSIVYKDSVDGWNSDLQDYEVEMIKATANVINKIPLGLHFTADALQLNERGESILLSDVSAVVKVNGDANGIIAAGTATDPKDTPIVIEITELKPGAVKKLDGLAFKAVAASKGMSGQQLNENQTLQLKNVRLKVPGGVKVDLN